jgi:hypothetical protein
MLRSRPPVQRARKIIASAVPQPEILDRFRLPVYRVHAKPFDVAQLMKDIRECVAGRGAVPGTLAG